jgi:hypothetical protein
MVLAGLSASGSFPFDKLRVRMTAEKPATARATTIVDFMGMWR